MNILNEEQNQILLILRRDFRYTFIGKITGGQALENGPETLAVRWFGLDQLPKRTTPFLKETVRVALEASEKPYEKNQDMPLCMAIALRWMIGWRDLRNRLTGRE
jgi:hypothetical protein